MLVWFEVGKELVGHGKGCQIDLESRGRGLVDIRSIHMSDSEAFALSTPASRLQHHARKSNASLK